jgi:hypothetical protein
MGSGPPAPRGTAYRRRLKPKPPRRNTIKIMMRTQAQMGIDSSSVPVQAVVLAYESGLVLPGVD